MNSRSMVFKLFRRVALPGLLMLLSAGLAWAGTVDVKSLVDRMPTQTAAEQQVVCGDLLKGGPEAVQAVCALLTPPATGGDSKARYLLGGLAFYTARPGAEAERRTFAGVLVSALRSAQDQEIKAFLLGLLRWCGGPECVAPLGACLRNPHLVEPATQALLAIRAPGSVAVLLAALKSAQGKPVITLVKALGELRAQPAVPAIVPLAVSANPDLRRTALRALAEIGPRSRLLWTDYSAGDVLQYACRTGDAREKAMAANLYLLYARRLAESGVSSRSVAVCREVLALGAKPGAARLLPAALNTLAAVSGDGAIPDLVAAANSSNRTVSVAALNILLAMQSGRSSGALNQILTHGPSHLRVALLNTLAGTDQPALSGAIAANLKNADPNVRVAAIQALHEKPGLASLLDLLPSAGVDDLPELKKHILELAGKKDLADVAAALAKTPAPARVVVLDILAQRHAAPCVAAVLGATADPDPAVRLAALKALGTTAAPEQLPQLVALAMKSTVSDEQSAALRSVVLVAKTIPDAEQRATALLAALPDASPPNKELLLGALPELGGRPALAAVAAAAQGPDEKLRTAAVAALANWPEASAAEAMLQAAKAATDPRPQALLLRGLVRVVRAGDQPADAKLGRYQEALALTPRPEDKKIVLGALVDIKTMAALALLDKYLDDPDLREEAANLAVLVACAEGSFKGLTEPAARPVLTKVAGILKDESARKKVEAQLAGIKD